ncbi:phage major tail tube protein [Rhodospira trueperi]|uniref:Phage major tail tube protein n=1 Tax=Rhodospira trueperi TaxID=69960 RepID=A0A1G7D494_9PROT|nr:phage major tail tube protein [Rhodospira trueperi]SDE45766.1 hypothetical protein SAMN05421720_1076 [Rhodospira trueperi]
MLPKLIKTWNVVVDGRSLAGVAEDLTLPELTRVTESLRNAGMLGPVEGDLGLEGLSLSFTLTEFNEDILRAWGLFGAGNIPVRFLAAARADDAEAPTDAIEVSVRGRWKKISHGTVKGGEVAKMTVEVPCTYYRYRLNGDTVIEIDLIAGTEIVDGVDRQADMRRAIGLVS